MKDDYLWDKSGEPDPEIQKLEEILGTLRYQPKPLELPEEQRRNYFPLLAIAATLVMALLAGIIWLSVRTSDAPQQLRAEAPVVPTPPKEKALVTTGDKNGPAPVQPVENVAKNRKSRKSSSVSTLKTREREEALAAKEQLMVALRLASEKLNMAHRKMQSTPPANQIKNQHRIG